MKVVAFAVAAIAAAVAAAIVIPDMGRPDEVRFVATPAPTEEPTAEPTVQPQASPSPSPVAVSVAAAEPASFAAPEPTERPRRLRDRDAPRGSSVTVVEGEHSEGCDGDIEDDEEEEEALEDCER